MSENGVWEALQDHRDKAKEHAAEEKQRVEDADNHEQQRARRVTRGRTSAIHRNPGRHPRRAGGLSRGGQAHPRITARPPRSRPWG
ncbi:hypothetical protein QJS66_13390 [Kocuria rhizophila]|nr:hypothetical protein QJS66_13390 [Kocuria rhizophila]